MEKSSMAHQMLSAAYTRHGALVHDMAAAVSGDLHRASDVVVGVFAALAAHEPHMDDRAVRDWLVRETCRRAAEPPPARTERLSDALPPPLAHSLWAVLPTVHRQALALACLAGWRCADIASLLGVAEAEVHLQLRTAVLTIGALVADTSGVEAALGSSRSS